MAFAPKEISPSNTTLRRIFPRGKFLSAAFNSDYWREFYAWCRSYVTGNPTIPRGPSRVIFRRECPVCGDAKWVLNKRRQLTPCPRWETQTKECRP